MPVQPLQHPPTHPSQFFALLVPPALLEQPEVQLRPQFVQVPCVSPSAQAFTQVCWHPFEHPILHPLLQVEPQPEQVPLQLPLHTLPHVKQPTPYEEELSLPPVVPAFSPVHPLVQLSPEQLPEQIPTQAPRQP